MALGNSLSSVRGTLRPFDTVIVTGGSSGIGKGFIQLLNKLHPGLQFCNLSRRAPALEVPPDKLRHFPCDLGKAAELEAATAELGEFLDRAGGSGKILLINNSGFGGYGKFPEPGLARQLEMADVNIRAVLHLTGLLLPRLKARGGAIINLASVVAFVPTAWLATYGASKAFVLHWSLALNEELRGSGVRALAVCPGPTATDFFQSAGMAGGEKPGWFTQTSEQVVVAALRALASGKGMVVSGWGNKVQTAAASKLPKALAARIAAKVLKTHRLKKTAP